jgi:hypothetical protein
VHYKLLWLLTFLPLVHVIGFEIAFLEESIYPLTAAIVGMLLWWIVITANAGMLCKRWEQALLDNDQQKVVICLLIIFIWLVALQLSSPIQSGVGRLGDYAVFVAAIFLLVGTRIKSSDILYHMGSSMACAAMISITVSTIHGKTTINSGVSFGFGWFTVIGCLATPILLAWLYYLWANKEADKGKNVKIILCLTAILALICISIASQRRGPFVGIFAGVAFLCALIIHQKYKWTKWLYGAVLLGGIVVLIDLIINNPGYGRSERFLLYRFAFETGFNANGLGNGPYGLLCAEPYQGLSTFLWVARDKMALHAHNELLNAWVEGGIVHLLAFIGILSLAAKRIVFCSDPVLRNTFALAFGAWIAHAMTDNTYGTPLGMAWSGLLLGAILCLPVSNQNEKKKELRILPIIAYALIMLNVFVNSYYFYLATITTDTDPYVRLERLQKSRDPIFVFSEASALLNNKEMENDVHKIVLDSAVNKIGWAVDLRLRDVAISEKTGDLTKVIESLVRLIHKNPFFYEAGIAINDVVKKDIKLAEYVPLEIKNIIGILNGKITPKKPQDITNPLQAAQYLALVERSVANNIALTAEQVITTKEIVKMYGRIPQVARLSLQLATQKNEVFGEYLKTNSHYIAEGLGSDYAVIKGLSLVTDMNKALNIMPVLKALYPSWIESFNQNYMAAFDSLEKESEREKWKQILRIWSLARSREKAEE